MAPADSAEESTFLGERLWPGVTLEGAQAEVERVAQAADSLRRAGRPVSHLHSSLMPTDETLFSWFRAGSAAEVAEVGDQAGVRFDRIVFALDLFPSRFQRRKEPIR